MLIPDNTEYPLLVLKYKHDCIRALRAYLVQDDDVPDDVTIALAFILLTEEVSRIETFMAEPNWD